MSFTEAVASALRQYVGFRGRARRSEYWWFFLFTFLVSLLASVVDNVLGIADELGNGPVGTVAALALVLPSLAVGVRRLHDTGRSGWWLLIGLIPLVGAIVLLVFFVQDSHAGPNQHGPNPKDPAGQAYGYGYGAPGQQQPGVGTGYEQYQQPGYQQPGYQQPGYQQPGYQQPGYQQPGPSGPGHGEPDRPGQDPRYGTPPA